MATARIKVKHPLDISLSQQLPLGMNPIEPSCLSRGRNLDKRSMPLLGSKFFNL